MKQIERLILFLVLSMVAMMVNYVMNPNNDFPVNFMIL